MYELFKSNCIVIFELERDLMKMSLKIIFGVLVLIVIIAGLYYYNVNNVKKDNAKALSLLNSNIKTYGSNVRYLLANSSAYYSAFGKNSPYINFGNNRSSDFLNTFINLSDTKPDIYSIISQAFNKSNSSALSQINNTDFYNLDSWVIGQSSFLPIIYSLGYYEVNYTYFISHFAPKGIDDLQMSFSMILTGQVIDYDAFALVMLYGDNYFNLNHNPNEIGFPSIHNIPVNDLGIGIAMSINKSLSGAITTGWTITTELDFNSSYGNYMTVMPSEWLASMYLESNNGVASGDTSPQLYNNTSMKKLAYILATVNYLNFYDLEMLYNRTISPEIMFIGYMNNTVLVNLGNLNLSTKNISVSIDGNQTGYERLYNLLLIKNKHLDVGEHVVNVSVDGRSMNGDVYVSPVLPSNISLSEPNVSYSEHISNYTNETTAYLSFNIANNYPSDMIISNISITSGYIVEPIASDLYSNNSTFAKWHIKYGNWTTYKSAMPILYKAVYYKFNSISKSYILIAAENRTNVKEEYFTPNFTTYNIPLNTTYSIGRNDSILFKYKISSFPEIQGTTAYYNLTFDTNYGKAHVILGV